MKRSKIAVMVCMVAACACLLMAGCQSETYTPQLKTQAVSAAALGKDGVLRVGVNANSAPLAGRSESSDRIMGIDAEVAAYLADQMGLKLELSDVGADPETALSSGTVDMLLGVDASDTDSDFWRSSTYIGKGVVLFGTANESALPTADSSVAAQGGTWSEKRVVDLLGDDVLVKVDDLRTALEDVAAGTVRYAAGDVLAGAYLADYYNYDVKPIGLMQEAGGYCAAVPNANTELQAAVAGALETATTGGVMNIIETAWIGAPLDLENLPTVESVKTTNKKNNKKAKKSEEAQTEEAEQPAEEAPAEEAPAEEAPADEFTPVEETPVYDDGTYYEEGTYY